MFPSWRQYGNERQQRPVNFCERCGAVVDGEKDSTLALKFKGEPKTLCANDVIQCAAEELERGESS